MVAHACNCSRILPAGQRAADADACREVADLIYRVVDDYDDESVKAEVGQRVDELTDEYTLYE